MTFEQLCERCEERGIDVCLCPLNSKNPAFVIELEGVHIFISNALSEEQRLKCLIHELGHVCTNSLYSLKTPESERLQLEAIADKWGEEFLEGKNVF